MQQPATDDGPLTNPDRLVDWRAIVGDENVFLLAAHPGDETTSFGGLIARTCAAGRPPFVAVLTDGSGGGDAGGAHAVAMRRERETRAAAHRLGLPADRLLFVGLFDGSVPRDGPRAEAVAAAIDLLMWRSDCHVLCAAANGDADTAATADLARAVARRTGLQLVLRTDAATPGSHCLDARTVMPAIRLAYAEHARTADEIHDRIEAYMAARST